MVENKEFFDEDYYFTDIIVKEDKVNEVTGLSRKTPNSVGKFWVLYDLRPERFEMEPEMGDLLFETDLSGYVLQIKGGMEESLVEGIFKSSKEAKRFFEKNHPEAWNLMMEAHY